jgi:ubiquitin C-terminal hydrolase
MTALGFRTTDQLVEFIHTQTVVAPLTEFAQDFLSTNRVLTVPPFHQVMNSIVAHGQLNTGFYTAENPDKSTWQVHNHFARFIVRVYALAQASDSAWQGVNEPDISAI